MVSSSRLLFAVASLALLSGCARATDPSPRAPAAANAALPGAFVDDRGAEVTFASYAGEPVVVTMFYRSCAVRCPLTIRKMKAIEERFAARGVTAELVLVTLDPRNDTVDRLRAFKEAEGLGERWHLLRGSLDATRALGRALHVHAAYDDMHVDHDVRIVTLDASGREAKSFSGVGFDADLATSL